MSYELQREVVSVSLTHTGSTSPTYSSVLAGIDLRHLEYLVGRLALTRGGSPTNPSVTVTIQTTTDSPVDATANSAWVDLMAFDALTATGSDVQEASRLHGTEARRMFLGAVRIKYDPTTDANEVTWTGTVTLSGR